MDRVTFGLGQATRSGKDWIDGGHSAEGFLGGVAAGPMESTFHLAARPAPLRRFAEYHLVYAVVLTGGGARRARAFGTGLGRSAPGGDMRPLPGASAEDDARIRTRCSGFGRWTS
ncbi:hypothetical protein [Streptomyces sp. NBC_00019]|uniref:hypothetical protein n=1 Tax=Streptomyces sp. NBC_00019 TaxID=2975623 RepID=UPI0032445EA7